MLQYLPGLRSAPGFASPRQFTDLLWVSECQLLGKRRLQIRQKKLHLPSRPQEEVHVDLMGGSVVPGHVGSIGEEEAKQSTGEFVAVMTRNGPIFSNSVPAPDIPV
jgi:hypothetical protein